MWVLFGITVFRPTKLSKEAVPDHGVQAHEGFYPDSEKPKMVTNCIHLSNDGRKLGQQDPPSPRLGRNKFKPSIRLLHNKLPSGFIAT